MRCLEQSTNLAIVQKKDKPSYFYIISLGSCCRYDGPAPTLRLLISDSNIIVFVLLMHYQKSHLSYKGKNKNFERPDDCPVLRLPKLNGLLGLSRADSTDMSLKLAVIFMS